MVTTACRRVNVLNPGRRVLALLVVKRRQTESLGEDKEHQNKNAVCCGPHFDAVKEKKQRRHYTREKEAGTRTEPLRDVKAKEASTRGKHIQEAGDVEKSTGKKN